MKEIKSKDSFKIKSSIDEAIDVIMKIQSQNCTLYSPYSRYSDEVVFHYVENRIKFILTFKLKKVEDFFGTERTLVSINVKEELNQLKSVENFNTSRIIYNSQKSKFLRVLRKKWFIKHYGMWHNWIARVILAFFASIFISYFIMWMVEKVEGTIKDDSFLLPAFAYTFLITLLTMSFITEWAYSD